MMGGDAVWERGHESFAGVRAHRARRDGLGVYALTIGVLHNRTVCVRVSRRHAKRWRKRTYELSTTGARSIDYLWRLVGSGWRVGV